MDNELIDDFNEIAPNLFLGGHPAYGGIDKFQYVFALNGRPSYYIPIGKMVIVRPFDDVEVLPNVEMLHDLADMVVKYMKKGPVLVHCAAGLNRSALIVGLVLIKTGMKPSDAVAHIQKTRSMWCLHNDTFRNWLLAQDPADQQKIWTPA